VVTPDDFNAVLEEAGSGSPRAAALIGAALLEDVLERVLLSRMIRLNSRRRKKLFGSQAPLESMTARIRVAHAFNLIDDNLKRDLTIISEIRNRFAHTPGPV
jgi:hypothetical protein